MTRFKLIINNFTFYLKANLLVAVGVAISTAVLTGALIIGDSVTYSLEKSAYCRLGNTTHVVTTSDRFFRAGLAKRLSAKGGFHVAPALVLEGLAVAGGGKERANKVQITGIDDQFVEIAGSPINRHLSKNEVVIGINLAERLHLKTGDSFLVRIKKASLAPLNAPFVSGAETSVSFRATVKGIADQHTLGFFNLKNSQVAPYNLFLSLSKLNGLMKLEGKANRLMIVAPFSNNLIINNILKSCFTTEDAGLIVKDVPATHEKEILSERVFIDDQIIDAFKPFGNSRPILTYFTNSLEFNGKKSPYPFVSTIDDTTLKYNEIIINKWTSSDLGARVGDRLELKYFEIGPLRQLVEKGAQFIVKKIVPIEGKYGDRDLMPFLSGMSDAVNCRDWETGVPIRLEAIRDKDEAYWKQYSGTPKAFISLKRALQIWSNRFGNYTAIRIGENSFSEEKFRSLFAASISPASLGIVVADIKANGLKAARDGTDFSSLFIGLNFFILVAAIILTSLLFLLNLENRRSQIGTLLMIGFDRKQIRRLLLSEGLMVATIGGAIGLVAAIFYTKLIFIALNSLWWAVVRTSVLEIAIYPTTLATGLTVSLIMAMLTIIWSVNNSFKRQAVELQRQQDKPQEHWVAVVKKCSMVASFVLVAGLIGHAFWGPGHLGPNPFFLSGGLLLLGLLLFADGRLRKSRYIITDNFSVQGLCDRNRSQNLGRSLSVVILFALGTFLVVSTGANRQGILTNPNDKKSGTGGFQFFAETSVPVLFSLYDKGQRLAEGLGNGFTAVQFGKIDGDDASCLNLNRVSNPAILGAEPELLKGRFKFATKIPGPIGDDIWGALDFPLKNGVVPAIADQTVIQWGLGMEIGDTLFYRNEFGATLRLKLVAGLSPSVFQGYILISNNNFLKNFPSSSGSNLFLIDVPQQEAKKTTDELNTVFRDYGWEMTNAAQRLMEFNSVTNTYLSIFLALGSLGLILGTIGLAVVLARSIQERKGEIYIMKSLGFRRHQVVGLLVREYVSLLVCGLLIGLVSAAVAVSPNFLTQGGGAPFPTVLMIVLAIFVNGAIWIGLLSLFLSNHKFKI